MEDFPTPSQLHDLAMDNSRIIKEIKESLLEAARYGHPGVSYRCPPICSLGEINKTVLFLEEKGYDVDVSNHFDSHFINVRW